MGALVSLNSPVVLTKQLVLFMLAKLSMKMLSLKNVSVFRCLGAEVSGLLLVACGGRDGVALWFPRM